MASEQVNEERQVRQTSFYLVRRAEALLGALQFFDAPQRGPHLLVQFLAQSDFWEWELDNLIYSFTNLAERQKTWNSPDAAILKLHQLGIALDTKMLKQVKWRGGGWRTKLGDRRVAPVDLLRDVIDVWTRLIDACETRFIAPWRDQAERWNIQTRLDFNSLRRTMPGGLDDIEPDDENE